MFGISGILDEFPYQPAHQEAYDRLTDKKPPRSQSCVGDVNALYPESASGVLMDHNQHSQPPRTRDETHRHSYPSVMPAQYNAATFAQGQAAYDAALYATGMADSKCFRCPLYSCARLFKGREDLKQHILTHTLERPYGCPQCNKCFAHRDDLNEHVRTHLNPNGIPGGTGDEGALHGYRPDVVGMLNYPHGDGMDVVGSTFVPLSQDVQMCKVETDGNGLEIMPFLNQEVHNYSSAPATATSIGFAENNTSDYANDGQWAFRSNGSPSFSNHSTHSSPHGSLAGSNRSSIAGPPAGYTRPSASPHLHSNGSSAGSSVYGDDMTTSRSAPSHSQTFDQLSSFASGMIESAAGAVRRHRSTTPALFRSRDPIHRPLTAASAEFAPDIHGSSPGTDSGIIGSGRQYHPYAYGHNSASQSCAGSAHSSPSVYPTPLAADGAAAALQARGRRSRHSLGVGSGLQEQMMMMMSMNLNQNEGAREEFFGNDANAGNPSSTVYAEGTYRTDSPTSFSSQNASPASYPIDPPVHYGADGYPLQYELVEKQSAYLIPPAGAQQHQQPYGQGVDSGYYHQA
jgi:transcription factor STE12